MPVSEEPARDDAMGSSCQSGIKDRLKGSSSRLRRASHRAALSNCTRVEQTNEVALRPKNHEGAGIGASSRDLGMAIAAFLGRDADFITGSKSRSAY